MGNVAFFFTLLPLNDCEGENADSTLQKSVSSVFVFVFCFLFYSRRAGGLHFPCNVELAQPPLTRLL